MTAYRPFIAPDNNESVRQFTSAEFTSLIGRISSLQFNDPVATLSVVASNGTLSPAMEDTRYRSGPTAITQGNQNSTDEGVAEYVQQNVTGDPELISGGVYDRISQTLDTATQFVADEAWYNGQLIKPVRVQGVTLTNNGFQAMTYQDVLDTFFEPIYAAYKTPSPSDPQAAGSYFISTNASESGATQLGGMPIFVDTNANYSNFSTANIPSNAGAYMDPFDSTNYYLHRINQQHGTQGTGYRTPLIIDYNNSSKADGLRSMTYAEFDSFFVAIMNHQFKNVTGNRLRYNMDLSTNNPAGDVISSVFNMQMQTANPVWSYQNFGVDDYRSIEFPNGTVDVQNTWNLTLERY